MLCEFCVLLQKPLALSISAGDNPFLRMDLVLIPRGFFFSSVSRRVPAERKYLAKHDKERGSRDVEKKNQTEEGGGGERNTRGMFFCHGTTRVIAQKKRASLIFHIDGVHLMTRTSVRERIGRMQTHTKRTMARQIPIVMEMGACRKLLQGGGKKEEEEKKATLSDGLSGREHRSPYTRERCVTQWCCQRNQTPSPLR